MAGAINAQARTALKTELANRDGGGLAGSVQSREVNTDDQGESSQAITQQETLKETQLEALHLRQAQLQKGKKDRGESLCHKFFRDLPEAKQAQARQTKPRRRRTSATGRENNKRRKRLHFSAGAVFLVSPVNLTMDRQGEIMAVEELSGNLRVRRLPLSFAHYFPDLCLVASVST